MSDWDDYLGKVYNAVICDNLVNYKNIVEFAPGKRLKTIMAIKGSAFTGDLFVIDSDESIENFVLEKYPEIIPNAKIHFLCMDFVDAIIHLPPKIDLFLANHPFDDMLLAETAQFKNIRNVFNGSVESEKQVSKLWFEIGNNEILKKDIFNLVYDKWLKLFKTKMINKIVICQYISNRFFASHKSIADKITDEFFSLIKSNISNSTLTQKKLDSIANNYDKKFVGTTTNSYYWIDGQPKQ